MTQGHDRRFRVLDCLISCVDMPMTASLLLDEIATQQGGYVCFSNVHTVVTSRRDWRLREITNDSFLAVPDGKPLSIVGKLRGVRGVETVAGPDFMPFFIQRTKGVRHFFFGSSVDTLEKLVANIRMRYPETVIAGYYSPPFGDIPRSQMQEIISLINGAKPDIVWVGLGAPKQEYWMADHWHLLKPAILMGVGAAFDLHAGNVPRAPEWMRKTSLEWLHRLCHEPRRLWRRYLYTNLLFIYYLAADFLLRREARSVRSK